MSYSEMYTVGLFRSVLIGGLLLLNGTLAMILSLPPNISYELIRLLS